MDYSISLLLDGLILVFLCVTIFYAARLSLFMKSFREGRSDMERLVRDLNETVDKAEASIAIMKKNAGGTEEEIRLIINEAKFLSDELRFMNETGDSLADRLEKLADRNRELVDLMESSGGIGTQKITPYDPSNAGNQTTKKVEKSSIEKTFEIEDFDLDSFDLDEDDEFDFMALGDGAYREEEAQEKDRQKHHSQVKTDAKSKVRSFAIFDREYADELEEQGHDDASASQDDFELKGFHSRAEQDLYEALQRKKKAYDAEQIDNQTTSKKVSKLS